ncbi:basic proline-rich protein-like [Pipra filicauda]|uniref:Basic proline-rich protein-like n=1 Tax=Pipra filicauda TaxID=649802 RepID=A0A7R5KN31_9PASS|nr:basic proline-rich protein-like [Pipra filicauda]
MGRGGEGGREERRETEGEQKRSRQTPSTPPIPPAAPLAHSRGAGGAQVLPAPPLPAARPHRPGPGSRRGRGCGAERQRPPARPDLPPSRGAGPPAARRAGGHGPGRARPGPTRPRSRCVAGGGERAAEGPPPRPPQRGALAASPGREEEAEPSIEGAEGSGKGRRSPCRGCRQRRRRAPPRPRSRRGSVRPSVRPSPPPPVCPAEPWRACNAGGEGLRAHVTGHVTHPAAAILQREGERCPRRGPKMARSGARPLLIARPRPLSRRAARGASGRAAIVALDRGRCGRSGAHGRRRRGGREQTPASGAFPLGTHSGSGAAAAGPGGAGEAPPPGAAAAPATGWRWDVTAQSHVQGGGLLQPQPERQSGHGLLEYQQCLPWLCTLTWKLFSF